jgi:hypothetical protein
LAIDSATDHNTEGGPMADYASAANAIIAAIEIKANQIQSPDSLPAFAAPLLLQLAQAYAAVREASK